MASDDNVATAALVVGLVALIVAAGQLLQQMFSTADGYRRCKRSVVGPWANRTTRKWHWGQFRFETRFTTPEIVLYDWRAVQGMRTGKSVYSAALVSTSDQVIDFDAHDIPYELRETIRPSAPDQDVNSSGDMVSWTSLLRQLYLSQSKWYQSYQIHVLPPTSSSNVVGYGTKIGVIYRERTWDLMPPDSIRPMASSRLGTMIVLAIRLGMTWENLNIGDGIRRAEGAGHTLISTTIRGLGIVFQYNFNPDVGDMFTEEKPAVPANQTVDGMIPRRSIDMMSCGILPGVPAFKIPAIPLHGKTVAETARLLSSALLWLNVTRPTIARIADVEKLQNMQHKGYESVVGWHIHDMVALMSNFQPMRGSPRTQAVYPIQTNVALSVFSLPECRSIFVDRLANHHKLHDSDRDQLRSVKTRLEQIANLYRKDFWGEQDQAIVNDPSASFETKTKFIADLQEVYDWKTEQFQRIEGSLKYSNLVAAHITLAANAARNQNTAFSHSSTPARLNWRDTALFYVEGIPDLIEELRAKLDANQNSGITDSEIEDAWWTLMLRGIIWRMSIFFSHQETLVPSRLYYDQTPVFIM